MAGFTLLELIVVLLVFSVMSVMAYGGLRSVLDSRAAVEASLDRTADFQRGFRKLREDLRLLRARSIRDGFGDRQPAFVSERDQVISFTRGGWRNPLYAPRPTLERVRYRLTNGVLYRDSWRVLDQAQDSQPVELALLSGVDRMQFRFMDAAREWQSEWRAEDGSLPLLVELRLETRDWGALRWVFRPGLPPEAVQLLSRFENASPQPTPPGAPGEAPPPATEAVE